MQYKYDQPCDLWNKPCVHNCGYIHFSADTPDMLTQYCAGGFLSSNSTNSNIDLWVSYELDEMPDYLLECIMSSSTFLQNSSTYNNILAIVGTKMCNYSIRQGRTPQGPDRRVHHHCFSYAGSSHPSCGISYFIFDNIAARAGSAFKRNADSYILSQERGWKQIPYCTKLQGLGL